MTTGGGVRLAASAYTVPTDRPEADGTLAWDSTTLVLVEASAEDRTGLGWTYGPAQVAGVATDLLGPAVTDVDPRQVPAAQLAMQRALRNAGRPGVAGLALSAVDCALWDLKARLVDVSLTDLLGRCRDAVPVYGSGGFTTYDDEEQDRQLRGWTEEQGIPRVKIKIGESCGSEERRDLARVRAARRSVGDGVELYVDANGAYSRKQAVRVGAALDACGVTWFEEPVSSDDLAGLALVRDRLQADVAAGEYGYDLAYFARLAPSVDCLQVDVTRCGGISELLRVAALAAGHGLSVSTHCAPQAHLAVAAAVPNLRHAEWFHDHVRIEALAFDGARLATGGAVRLGSGSPGNGLTVRRRDLEPYRVT